MAAIGEPYIRDTSAQDVTLDPALRARKRRLIVIGVASLGLVVVIAMAVVIRTWLSTTLVVPRERVRIATVTRGAFVRDVAAQGTVVVADSPTLFASGIGTVTFLVKAGDVVKEGQVLAAVDSPSLRSESAREQAALDGLAVGLDRSTIEARRQMLQEKQATDLANTRIRATQRELERAQAAWEQGVIPKRDLDRAQDERDDARLTYDHAVANTKLQEDSLNFELKTKRVEIERQKLAVKELQRRVDALSVKSPVKGMVGSLAVNQKSAVAENAALLTVVDLSALEVEFRVAETYAGDLTSDMNAEIDYGGHKYAGLVTSISPEVQNSEVKGRLRFADKLPPGVRQNQRVSVRIVLDQRPDTLKVERGAFTDVGSYAYVVEGDVARKRDVTLGAMSMGEVEIVSGLKEGESVVVSSVEDFSGVPEARLTN
ncbi:MAG: HlyD family efflux transporter periplasmic adaptor subunit [Gammaproteobacteria bacterium]